MSQDPFDTAGIRRRVLRAWADEPARLREDANAEEDYARGGYRDRVVVELAQNAADAAARAGVQGRLWLRLDRDRLQAANVGAPLDAAAVLGLATLRASAKREDDESLSTVGRFGVGFSAVLAVTDRPAVVGRQAGVRFDARRAAALVRASADAALVAEVERRDGQVPILRLPFAVVPGADGGADGVALGPPDGYDTQVTLPLRDEAAHELVARLLAEVDEALLLALPGLHEVRIDVDGTSRVLIQDPDRWHLVRRDGRFTPEQLADRPTEERYRPGWHLTWALPVAGPLSAAGVVHAPTPTDELLEWPALLIATFPLEPSRRHIAPGPATDELVAQAAAAYADLVTRRAADGEPIWRLLPTGLPAPGLDAALRSAVLGELRRHPILPGADGAPVRPLDATVIEGPGGAEPQVGAVLAAAVPGLVTAPRSAAAGLRWLGVGATSLADAVEQLPLPADDDGWAARYDALAVLADDAPCREALAVLTVPLRDGRVVRGARGLVLARDLPTAALAALGVRVVAPGAEHPLLQRLGAETVSADAVLDLPEVSAAVARRRAQLDDEDGPVWHERLDGGIGGVGGGIDEGLVDQGIDEGTVDVASAVLELVAAAVAAGVSSPTGAGPLRPWLGDLVLRDEDDEPAPAAELVLPGSAAQRWLDPQALGVVSSGLVERWGPAVLTATGVLAGLTVTVAQDVPLTDDDEAHLAGWSDWVAQCRVRLEQAFYLGAGQGGRLEVTAAELTALPDLDAVLPEAWPEVWQLLTDDARARAAVVRPTRLLLAGPAGTRHLDVPSWSAWWLRQRVFGGRAWADPEAGPWLHTLLGDGGAAGRLDPQLRRALGAVASPAELAASGPDTLALLAERLADPQLQVPAEQLLQLWSVLAHGADSLTGAWRSPSRVRALRAGAVVLVAADDVVVVDSPQWLQRPDLGAVVVAPPGRADALADVLDVAVADELAPGRLTGDTGTRTPVAAPVAGVLARPVEAWFEHEDLQVDGVPVAWWVLPDGAVHAGTVDGLARALAWAGGCWPRRHVIAQLLVAAAAPSELVDVAFE